MQRRGDNPIVYDFVCVSPVEKSWIPWGQRFSKGAGIDGTIKEGVTP